jgi:hypothetical protein
MAFTWCGDSSRWLTEWRGCVPRFYNRVDRAEREVGMLAKISLTAAFFLMAAPPVACASNRAATSLASRTLSANRLALGVVVAQDSQQNLGTSDNDNDNDNDSNDSDDDKQDSDGNQTDQQNAAGNDQQIPPTVLGGPDDGQPQGEQPEPRPAPGMNVYPVNPYQ